MAKAELIYLGIRGSVVAMERQSGRRVWETKLKGGAFVTLLVDRDRVLAGTQGEFFCLDAATGNVLWYDPLKGYGLGLMSIATQNGSSNPAAAAAEQTSRADDGASAAAAAGA
jgi:outer membrane protein assembly factor BamB